MKTIKFIKSPTGAHNLAYCVGEQDEFTDERADELVEGGFAELVELETKTEKAVKASPKTEKAVK